MWTKTYLTALLIFIGKTTITYAQEAVQAPVVIQEVEYIHQHGNNSRTYLGSFFKNSRNHDTIVGLIGAQIAARWQRMVEKSSSLDITAKGRFVSGTLVSPLPKFKPKLPDGAAPEKSYLFVQVFGADVDEQGAPIAPSWVFRYQVKRGEEVLAQDKSEVGITSAGSMGISEEESLRILEAGIRALFNKERQKVTIYQKTLTPEKTEKLSGLFPSHQKIKLVPDVNSYTVLFPQPAIWHLSPAREKVIYTDKNVGGDIVSGLATSVLGIGTTAQRKLVFEDAIGLRNSVTDEAVHVNLYITGLRLKEKERLKAPDGTKSVHHEFSFHKTPDSSTHGDVSLGGKIVATFRWLPAKYASPLTEKTAPLDALLGLPAERGSPHFSETGYMSPSTIALKGEWEGDPFAILYRDNGCITYYIWKNEVVAFSKQKEYAPELFVLKNNAAPLSLLTAVQHVMYTNLRSVHTFD